MYTSTSDTIISHSYVTLHILMMQHNAGSWPMCLALQERCVCFCAMQQALEELHACHNIKTSPGIVGMVAKPKGDLPIHDLKLDRCNM